MNAHMTRRLRGLSVLLTAALVGAIVVAVPAQATSTPPWLVTDAVLESPNDATAKTLFPDPEGNAKELGPINGNVYKLGVIHTTPTPVLGLSNPNPGTDMTDAWISTYTENDGDIWGYFAFKIESFSTGQSAWEFMKSQPPDDCDYTEPSPYTNLIAHCNPWENRQAGDFFVVADYQGNGVDLGIRTWGLVNGVLTLGALDPIDDNASVNTTTGFVEMAVNLTDDVFGDITDCITIGNIIPSTLTGNSDSADYKDVVLAGVADAVQISTCGSLEVVKKLNPSTAPVGDNTFQWDVDRSGGGDVKYGGTSALQGVLTGHDDSDSEQDLIAGTDYQISETILTSTFARFELEKIECKVGTTGTPVDVTSGGTFTVAVGETTYCTITNKELSGTLKVYKEVTNDNGGTLDRDDFTFDVTGPNSYSQQNQVFGNDPDNDGDQLYGLWTATVPRGTYSASEDDTAGYTENDDDCASVDVPAGGVGECTIYNNDDPAQLTVTKVVVNTAGGAAEADDFMFSVSGVNASTGNGFVEDDADKYSESTTLTGLSAGAYGVTEDGTSGSGPVVIVKGGVTYHVTYDAGCTGTLTNGGSTTCTITNTAQKANPTATTVQTWVLHDSFTVSGYRSGAPDVGSVTFQLFDNIGCLGDPVGTETVALNAATVSTVNGVAVTETDTYYWVVSYPGDTFNNPFGSGCGAEKTQLLAKDDKGGGRDDFTP